MRAAGLPVMCSEEANVALLRPTVDELGWPGGVPVYLGQHHLVRRGLQSCDSHVT